MNAQRLFASSILALFTATLGLVATERDARACSGRCFPVRLLPSGAAATVPADVGAFPIYAGSGLPGLGADAGSSAPTLRDGSGATVPTSVERLPEDVARLTGFTHLVRPTTALVAGPHSLDVPSACDERLAAKASFVVTEAKPSPTKLGSLSGAPGRGTVLANGGGGGAACVTRLDAAQVRLTIEADPSFAPFASVALYEVDVDGKPWNGPVVDYEAGRLGPASATDRLTLFAPCNAAEVNGADPGLAEGAHTVTVRARLPGVAETPALSATLGVTLSCGSGGSSASPPGTSPEAAPSTDSGGSCNAGGGTAAGLGELVVALGAVFTLGRARRRRAAR